MSTGIAPSLSMESKIALHPLSSQIENGVVIVGRGDQFLELPLEGLDFIDWLNGGMSLAEARSRFEERFNPFPDDEVIDVVNAFLECNFIAAINDRTLAPAKEEITPAASRFPREWAQALFSTPMLLAWMAFTIPAFSLLVSTPALWPQRADYFWIDYNFIVVLVAMLAWFIGMAMHETAHWLACRAKGINATITWTQRMGFFPMSQTIMHNIWAVPRAARLLPLAAGMMWDIFSISTAIYLLFFAQSGLLVLAPLVVKFLKFYLLFICMALASQFWLFSKMDGYFLLSSIFGQRNLQADTYSWLRSKFSKARTFDPPASGMKFIYSYALITLIWGGLFLGQYVSISLMIKVQLVWESLLKIINHATVTPIQFADGVGVFAYQMIYWGLLIYVYIRETIPGWRNK